MRVPLIDNNPLRVLGVFSNATLREIEQNKAQLRAFARVDQKAQLPLWLNGASMLPQLPDITEEMLSEAEAELTLQDDCDRYAIFWFERDSRHANEDLEACTLLNENRVDEARQLWLQRTDHAAQKNLLLLAVAGDDWSEIATRAAKCFEGSMAEFRTFMGEVVESSFDDDSQSNQLLGHFTEDPWMTEVKRLLESHHKSRLDDIIDRLQRSGITDEKLLRYEVDEALDELGHLDDLKTLLGRESIVYTFYSTEISKLLSDKIKGYYSSYPCEFSSEWAKYRFNLLLRHLDAYGSAYDTAAKARNEFLTSSSFNKLTKKDESNDGCGCSWLALIAAVVLISKIVSYCGSNHQSYSYNLDYTPVLTQEELDSFYQRLEDIKNNQQIIEDERLQIEITEDSFEQSSAPLTEDVIMSEKQTLRDLKKRDSLMRLVVESVKQNLHKDPFE